jgi:hypothetical protein
MNLTQKEEPSSPASAGISKCQIQTHVRQVAAGSFDSSHGPRYFQPIASFLIGFTQVIPDAIPQPDDIVAGRVSDWAGGI